MSFAFSLIVVFAIVYTMFSIFIFCFANHNFVLLVNGLPIPFVAKTIAGTVGVIVWIFGIGWLSKLLGKFEWADPVIFFIYMPMFFWIDIGKLIYLIHEDHEKSKIAKAIAETNARVELKKY